LASSNVIEYFLAFHSKYRYVSCIVSSMSQSSVVYLPSISKPNGAVVSSGSLEYSSVSVHSRSSIRAIDQSAPPIDQSDATIG
jgi:hypothetical protein